MASTTDRGFPYPDPDDFDKPRLDIEELAKAIDKVPGVMSCTEAERDVLTELWRGRTIFNLTSGRLEVNPSGTAGDWQWIVDARQPVPVNAGGTGLSVAPSVRVNLASGATASGFTPEPRPGVEGILGIANGGTGAGNAAGARANLSVYSKAEIGELDGLDLVAIFDSELNA